MTDLPPNPIAFDLGGLVQSTVASLYSHLVTRPTGRAVRMAIENRLSGAAEPSLSVIDLSEVRVLDFSCADEVVAKLLLEHGTGTARRGFFVFAGVGEPHREPILAVLERRGLAAVAETGPGRFELLGGTAPERSAWAVLEERGSLDEEELPEALPDAAERAALAGLAERGLAFRGARSGRFHALSRLVRPRP